ncbi:hypothetical protein HHL19_03405 [Streptomyces sp. R302]|uniref:hypothetical protein n=1 Tax=unclassified Streptomyces TaxID=2593676 RepID=UPI00145F81E4|nr:MULTISPECIES: hypothetical protein [unclassified Streptomyces]NML49396.1 hypothetical protein [Streptomyces sp. R301]NML77723.1 hypothetical protein [Streptomyces sp. R302]
MAGPRRPGLTDGSGRCGPAGVRSRHDGRRRAEGSPPYERVHHRGEPPARHGEVRATGTGDRTLRAHVSGGRGLVTTDSLEYTPWGLHGPAYLLDLADGTVVPERRAPGPPHDRLSPTGA